MSLLAKYTERSKTKTMTDAMLLYAIRDVSETLDIYKDASPTEAYPAKLWAEFDAYTVEINKRRKGKA